MGGAGAGCSCRCGSRGTSWWRQPLLFQQLSWQIPLPCLCRCLPACLPPRLQEQRGERLLVACSLLLAGLQAACTYVVWAAAGAQAREQRKRAD